MGCWPLQGHGKSRIIITKGQFRGNSVSHSLCFGKNNTFPIL
jgi:hypothetical protein